MRPNSGWLWIAAAALAGALGWSIAEVVSAPLETGEVYPPFSSLRPDPMGSKALYESFGEIVPVERLYKKRSELSAGETLFVLGVDAPSFSALGVKTLEEYEKLVHSGGRLVIAFTPARMPRLPVLKRPVEDRWGIRFHYRRGQNDESRAVPRETALYFEAGPQWRALGHESFERSFGAGAIVLAADTFALSNEGLRDARDAAFISTLAGSARRVIFDENHFGVVETGSVTKLMRKYRLEGAVAVLAIAAALFVWSSASSFLPPRASEAAGAIAGRDSMDGMASLLYRAIREKDLIGVCAAEWSKSGGRGSVREAIGGKNPVDAYRAACAAIKKQPENS